MKHKIALFKNSLTGPEAGIKFEGEEITIVKGSRLSPKETCYLAGHRLHELANIFEALAAEKSPYSAETQRKINRRRKA